MQTDSEQLLYKTCMRHVKELRFMGRLLHDMMKDGGATDGVVKLCSLYCKIMDYEQEIVKLLCDAEEDSAADSNSVDDERYLAVLADYVRRCGVIDGPHEDGSRSHGV